MRVFCERCLFYVDPLGYRADVSSSLSLPYSTLLLRFRWLVALFCYSSPSLWLSRYSTSCMEFFCSEFAFSSEGGELCLLTVPSYVESCLMEKKSFQFEINWICSFFSCCTTKSYSTFPHCSKSQIFSLKSLKFNFETLWFLRQNWKMFLNFILKRFEKLNFRT